MKVMALSALWDAAFNKSGVFGAFSVLLLAEMVIMVVVVIAVIVLLSRIFSTRSRATTSRPAQPRPVPQPVAEEKTVTNTDDSPIWKIIDEFWEAKGTLQKAMVVSRVRSFEAESTEFRNDVLEALEKVLRDEGCAESDIREYMGEPRLCYENAWFERKQNSFSHEDDPLPAWKAWLKIGAERMYGHAPADEQYMIGLLHEYWKGGSEESLYILGMLGELYLEWGTTMMDQPDPDMKKTSEHLFSAYICFKKILNMTDPTEYDSERMNAQVSLDAMRKVLGEKLCDGFEEMYQEVID